MNCLQVVKYRLTSLPYEPIESALKQINITTRNNDNKIRGIDDILKDITNFFKSMTFENRQDWEEIRDKFYKDGYIQNQIYCYERDVLEDRIHNRNILMYDICNKLAGTREGWNLLKYMINRL